MQSVIHSATRIVVKVGSSLVTNDGKGLDMSALARWAAEIADLKRRGKEVVLVSSGAIAEGMQRLGWTRRPSALHELQAAAAVGHGGMAGRNGRTVGFGHAQHRGADLLEVARGHGIAPEVVPV